LKLYAANFLHILFSHLIFVRLEIFNTGFLVPPIGAYS
jgi:hypothetical protein